MAWVADRQLGLITTPQLHVAGVGRGSVEWRLETGTLHRRHRGVYLVGHGILVPGANELAAVLACPWAARPLRFTTTAVNPFGPRSAAPGSWRMT